MHKIANVILWASAGLAIGAVIALVVVIAAVCSLYHFSHILFE